MIEKMPIVATRLRRQTMFFIVTLVVGCKSNSPLDDRASVPESLPPVSGGSLSLSDLEAVNRARLLARNLTQVVRFPEVSEQRQALKNLLLEHVEDWPSIVQTARIFPAALLDDAPHLALAREFILSVNSLARDVDGRSSGDIDGEAQRKIENFIKNDFEQCCSATLLTKIRSEIEKVDLAQVIDLETFLGKFRLGGFEEKRGLLSEIMRRYYGAEMPVEFKSKVIYGMLDVELGHSNSQDFSLRGMTADQRYLQSVAVAAVAYSGPFMNKLFQQIGEEATEPALVELMAGVKDRLPAMPLEEVRRQITLQHPHPEKFDLDKTRLIGAASVGQAALLEDTEGRHFVAKLIKPGVSEFLAWESQLVGEIKMNPTERKIFTDVFESYAEEIDLAVEARYLDQAQKLYRDRGAGLAVVDVAFSSHKLLVMDVAQGGPLRAALDDPKVDLGDVAFKYRDFYRKWFEVALHDGFFHADPHFGNLFIASNGEATVLTPIDFGASGNLTESERTAAKWFGIGVHLGQPESIMEAFRILSPQAVQRNEALAADVYQLFERQKKPQGADVLAVVEKHSIALPKNFVLFQRATDYLGKQFGVLNQLLAASDRPQISPITQVSRGYFQGLLKNPLKGAKDISCLAAGMCSQSISRFQRLMSKPQLTPIHLDRLPDLGLESVVPAPPRKRRKVW